MPRTLNFSGRTTSSAPSAAAARVRRSATSRLRSLSSVELSCTAAARIVPRTARLTGQSTSVPARPAAASRLACGARPGEYPQRGPMARHRPFDHSEDPRERPIPAASAPPAGDRRACVRGARAGCRGRVGRRRPRLSRHGVGDRQAAGGAAAPEGLGQVHGARPDPDVPRGRRRRGPADRRRPQRVERQVPLAAALVARNGYEAVTMHEVERAWSGLGKLPRKPIVLTFDDGFHSQERVAFQELRKLGWPGVLYLAVNNLTWDRGITFDEVQTMLDGGWELGAPHDQPHQPDRRREGLAAARAGRHQAHPRDDVRAHGQRLLLPRRGQRQAGPGGGPHAPAITAPRP